MKIILVVGAILAVSQALDVHQEWANFKLSHSKSYKSQFEEHLRQRIFNINLQRIEEHNKKYEQGLTTYKMGVNQFTDLAPEEFMYMLGLSKKNKPAKETNKQYVSKLGEELPQSIDWRSLGAVREVKNQGQCGSCWSFSATGSLEGQSAIVNNKSYSLSEQYLVDCSKENEGCYGGWMDLAFEYIKENGIPTEEKYPYKGVNSKCRYNREDSVLSVNGYTDIKAGDEQELKSAVAKVGPISVAIQATSDLMYYKEGYFYDPYCSSDEDDLNHGVLAVGYGTEENGDYWIVKNSWGETWGENGFVKMARNSKNHCGIATAASYPDIVKE